jgi:hypothetical protein
MSTPRSKEYAYHKGEMTVSRASGTEGPDYITMRLHLKTGEIAQVFLSLQDFALVMTGVMLPVEVQLRGIVPAPETPTEGR